MEDSIGKEITSMENGGQEIDIKLTNCFICGDTYSNPKMLPCLHTYCLRCLETYRDEQTRADPGSHHRLACPKCRRMFNIPEGGIEALSSNLFFGRLAECRRLSTYVSFDEDPIAGGNTPCTVCTARAGEAENGHRENSFPGVERAAFVCFDCDENMCTGCAEEHRNQLTTKLHNVADLVTVKRNVGGVKEGEEQNDARLKDTLQMKQTQNKMASCEQHPHEKMSLYCRRCSESVCPKCKELFHFDHGIPSDVTVAEGVERAALEDGVTSMTDRIKSLRSLLKSISEQRASFEKDIDGANSKIRQVAEEIKSSVDANRDQLLSETEVIRANTIQELDKVSVDVTSGIEAMENFVELAAELIKMGTTSDVTSMAGKLQSRRKQLELIQHDVSVCSVKFKRSDPIKGNLIGKVAILDIDSTDPYVDVPTVVDIIPGNASVAGVTVLQQELYIVREISSNVDIYSSLDYSPIRRLKLESLRKPADITSNPISVQLYISDAAGYVYRLEPEGKVLKRWQVEGEPQGLYVASATTGNLFVTCYDSRQVKEYTSEGSCVRSFRLQQDVSSTWQTIPLPDSDVFVVCHGWESGKLHRICHVGGQGRTLVNSYGGSNGSGSGKLDAPQRIALDQYGYTFVADRNNDRIVLLSPNLVFVRDIISNASFGIKQPRRIFLDTNTGYLYVGLIDGRVVVFRIID